MGIAPKACYNRATFGAEQLNLPRNHVSEVGAIS